MKTEEGRVSNLQNARVRLRVSVLVMMDNSDVAWDVVLKFLRWRSEASPIRPSSGPGSGFDVSHLLRPCAQGGGYR